MLLFLSMDASCITRTQLSYYLHIFHPLRRTILVRCSSHSYDLGNRKIILQEDKLRVDSFLFFILVLRRNRMWIPLAFIFRQEFQREEISFYEEPVSKNFDHRLDHSQKSLALNGETFVCFLVIDVFTLLCPS